MELSNHYLIKKYIIKLKVYTHINGQWTAFKYITILNMKNYGQQAVILQWSVDQKVMKYNYIKEIFHHFKNQPKKNWIKKKQKKEENWFEMCHFYKIQEEAHKDSKTSSTQKCTTYELFYVILMPGV